MAETVFKKVDYTLKDLVGYIQIGEIGLPDIQRPFVWKNAKVRDLFDSMYRGYPVDPGIQPHGAVCPLRNSYGERRAI